MVDMNTYLGVDKKADRTSTIKSTNVNAGKSLDMTDFLTLMCTSLQNQTMDDTASMNDMLNQLVQMTVIQAINDISTLIDDSTTLTYSASLVGKEATIGVYEGTTLKTYNGIITGTGMLDGEQVVFLGDEHYPLSAIMCIGKLPENIDGDESEEQTPGDSGDVTDPAGPQKIADTTSGTRAASGNNNWTPTVSGSTSGSNDWTPTVSGSTSGSSGTQGAEESAPAEEAVPEWTPNALEMAGTAAADDGGVTGEGVGGETSGGVEAAGETATV